MTTVDRNCPAWCTDRHPNPNQLAQAGGVDHRRLVATLTLIDQPEQAAGTDGGYVSAEVHLMRYDTSAEQGPVTLLLGLNGAPTCSLSVESAELYARSILTAVDIARDTHARQAPAPLAAAAG